MSERPGDLTLTNWDMGGEPSAWAYLHAGTLLGSVEISAGGPAAYTDPADPFYRFEATLGWRPPVPETAYSLVSSLSPARPSGEVYEYTSVNTFVLGWLVSRVTGLSLDAVLAREIWSRGGFEAPLSLCVSADGAPAIHGGLSMRLRDLARFGMLFTSGSVVSAAHLRRIRARDGLELRYPDDEPVVPWPPSRQWNCVYDDGDLFKSGFGGQGLYVSVSRDLVIAYAGTPRADGAVHQLGAISRRLAVTLLAKPGAHGPTVQRKAAITCPRGARRSWFPGRRACGQGTGCGTSRRRPAGPRA